MNYFKRYTIGVSRLYGRVPVLGRPFRFQARMYQRNFWRTFAVSMVISVVLNRLVAKAAQRQMDKY